MLDRTLRTLCRTALTVGRSAKVLDASSKLRYRSSALVIMSALYDDLPWLAASSALWHQVLLVDRSILEHLLKTEQIIAIRWRMSTLQRDRLMANSPQLGGGERTGNNGHPVLDWFTQNDMPLGGASQESRDMPRSCHGQCPNIGRDESGAYVQAIGKTEFVTTALWRPTCPKRNRRRVFEGSRRNDPFQRCIGNSSMELAINNQTNRFSVAIDVGEHAKGGIYMFRMHHRFLVGVMYASFLIAPAASIGAELKDETLKTWDAYIQTVNSQMDGRLQGPFLWVDEDPDRVTSVRAGKIVVSPVGKKVPKPVPSGLIHDWMGAVFIPDVRLGDVLSAVRDYGHYNEFYKPTVVDAKPLGTEGSCDKYSMRVVNKETVAETALDTEYQACYLQLDELRWYGTAHSTRVQEIRHYGRPDEQELPPNQGTGYIWRLYSLARFEERDGGVYIELEAIALSRDVPVALRWVVDPIVRRVSRNTLLISLQQMEEAVRSTAGTANRAAKSSTLAACNAEGTIASASRIANRFASRQKP